MLLLTGATGFIGGQIARRLVGERRPFYALVRGAPGRAAAARLAATLGLSDVGPGVRVVVGDLAAHDCGLGPSQWRALRAEVTTVVNCAGDPRFFPDDLARFRATHIDGPQRLLTGLAGSRLATWAQLSTAYVCGRRTGRVLECEGEVGQGFHNPYEHVKLEAEEALRATGRAAGIDVRVLRPSIVVGVAPPTAGGGPANLFFDFLRMLAALVRCADGAPVPLRIEAAPDAPFNIVPASYVADAVLALAELDAAADTCCHLVAEVPAQAPMLDIVTERLGLRGVRLVDRRRNPLLDASMLERTVSRALAGYRDYLEQDVRFDDREARRLLAAGGITPPVLDAAAVHGLIDEALLASGPGTRLADIAPGA